MPGKESHIVLFDGVCNLCNRLVHFIIRHDRAGKFQFAPLQSVTGQALLKKAGRPEGDLATLVFISGDTYSLRSAAVLKVLRALGGAWKLFYVFMLIPGPVRDFMYGLVAGSRYKIFGKRDTCMVPSPELKNRFLDD